MYATVRLRTRSEGLLSAGLLVFSVQHGQEKGVSAHPTDLTRGAFLARSALAGGAALGTGAALLAADDGAAQAASERRALELLLLVELTEAAFYREAIKRGSLGGARLDFAETVLEQEDQHVAFVRQALGGGSDPKLAFEFGYATRDPDGFASAAAKLEDLAVAAYNGQAGNVSRSTLKAAATVVSVEARHAAWIRSIAGKPPAPDATDTARPADEVLEGLDAIGLKR